MKYQIVRVPANPGIDWVAKLSALVDQAMAEGWIPTGGPFYDGTLMSGCQAIYRAEQAPAGEVRLREPATGKRKP